MEFLGLLGQSEEDAIENPIDHHHPKEQAEMEGKDNRHQGADNNQHLQGKKSHGQPKDQGTPADMAIDFILFHGSGIKTELRLRPRCLSDR